MKSTVETKELELDIQLEKQKTIKIRHECNMKELEMRYKIKELEVGKEDDNKH